MNQITIGKLAGRSGVNLETIRYYERLGLMPEPPRTASGYRVYSSEAVQRLRFIRQAQQLGFSLTEISELLSLRASPNATCADVKRRAESKISDIEERIRALDRMKKALKKISASCKGRGPTNECPILEAFGEDQTDNSCRRAGALSASASCPASVDGRSGIRSSTQKES